ncbi:restriction endonuclease subunit S [Thermogemmatispora carboxidivorans]|uniref:restriction endonuclease subunit S n=1 Tax=Thermogemmatispora carboxidivorans TaxID=1382306 RepID=UPI00069A636F|nr:restriction endonuclease subunit S [Thermogemmatispora carboxidivorans]
MAGSWKRVPLAEIAEFTSKPREVRLTDYKAIPFVPMELIPSDKIAIDGFLMKDPSVISSGTFFKEGDILLPKITPSFENGKQAIAEDLPLPFGLATTEVIPLREKANISDKLFLFYFLLKGDVRQSLASRMEGTTGRQRLNTEALKTLPVPLPPLREQRAIARVLRAVQEVMQALRRELELERERKAALMHHLFRYGTRGEPTRQTEIGEIPQSWKVVKLGEYCYHPEYGYTASAKNWPVGPKFLRITDLNGSSIDWSHVPYCECPEQLKDAYLLRNDDIIVARIGATTGKAQLITNCPDNTIFASYLLRIRISRQSYLKPHFVAYFFQSDLYWRQISQNKGGKLKQGINIPIIENLLLPLTRIDEQDFISGILTSIDAKIAALERELALYQELFRALLEELMSGRLSVQPLLEQEPA